MNTPTTEPTRARAGDTWTWRRVDLADYPAPTWVLKYVFKSPAGGFEITAAADGTGHLVTLTSTQSAVIPAANYDYVTQVESSGLRYTIGKGRLRVLPNFRDGDIAAPLDGRSHARRMLDAIEAALEKRADSGQLDLVAKGINGRNLQRDPEALIKLRDFYLLEVRREEDAARIAAGLGSRRGVFVRFGR